MRCRDAYSWMLTAEAPEGTPPDDVRRHLRACGRCRQRYRRVRRLVDEVRHLPAPAEDPRARARFLASFRGQPSPRRPAAWPRRRALLAAAAALLVASLVAWHFWPAGRPHDGPDSADRRAELKPLPAPGGRALLARVLRRDLVLARAAGPLDQLRALTGMAADLGAAALRQAGRPARADLPVLAGLYERVLREGVAVRARALPPAQQAAELKPVLTQLERAESESQRAAAETPAAAVPLRQMATAARETVRDLRRPAVAPAPPAAAREAAPQAASLLEKAVARGLRLAAEDDPLRRAESCADMASELARAIVRDCATAGGEEMEQLGSCLGGFTGPAVETNLRRIDPATADAARRAEVERIRRQAAGATATLEQQLDQVPRPARAALVRALDAARRGHGRPAEDGKGWVGPDELGLPADRKPEES